MNPRLVILAIALVLAIAAAVSLRRTSDSLESSAHPDPSRASTTPSKTERIDENHQPDRLIGLDPSLHQLAIRLEELHISWEHNRPPVRGGYADWNDWREFALTQCRQLETSQIIDLIVWLEGRDHNDITEVIEYRQAFYQTWASRDPDSARDHVIALAERYELLGTDLEQVWQNVGFVESRDAYHYVLAGGATHDPTKTWSTFRQDLADPALQILPAVFMNVPEIFAAYASHAPADAWRLVLNEPGEDVTRYMHEGYADGAPARQDWEALGTEFVASLESRGLKSYNWIYESIAARWITEDPAAALDWYAARATLDAHDNILDPFTAETPVRSEDLAPAEYKRRLKIDLLEKMYKSHKDLTVEVAQALDQLLTEGDTEFVVAALGHFTGEHLHQWSTPLLAVVPNIPDPEIRNEVFLGLVEVLRPRFIDPFSPDSSFDEPNIPCEAVRDLAKRLDLPEDIRTQAEAAFRKIEEQEAPERANDPPDPPRS